MCDTGTTPGGFGTAAMIGGGIVSAAGAAGEARITRANYQYNALVGEFNAKLAGIRAQDAIELGRMTEQEVVRGAEKVKGAQVASIAGKGIALSSGSALDILAGTDILAARDIDVVRENTRKAVFAEELAAIEARTGAQISRTAAEGISPELAAGTSLINTTGQVADRWYKMSRTTSGGAT